MAQARRLVFVPVLTMLPLLGATIIASTASAPRQYPAADKVFRWVGRVTVQRPNGAAPNATAVAVGPHTLLTTAHVRNVTQVTLEGKSYDVVSTVEAGKLGGGYVDLRALKTSTKLPGWYSLAPAVTAGTRIQMVGCGRSGWVNAKGTGYAVDGGEGVRRAGVNTIDQKQVVNGAGPSLLSSLKKAGDAVVGVFDSGGGWFSNGKLVGISAFTFNASRQGDKAQCPDYGFASANVAGFDGPGGRVPAGQPYFLSGAVDVTDPGVAAWIKEQIG